MDYNCLYRGAKEWAAKSAEAGNLEKAQIAAVVG